MMIRVLLFEITALLKGSKSLITMEGCDFTPREETDTVFNHPKNPRLDPPMEGFERTCIAGVFLGSSK